MTRPVYRQPCPCLRIYTLPCPKSQTTRDSILHPHHYGFYGPLRSHKRNKNEETNFLR